MKLRARRRTSDGGWNGHHVAVIGARGGIGEHLCLQLEGQGALVTSLDLVTGFDATEQCAAGHWFRSHPEIDTVIYAAGVAATGPLTRAGSGAQMKKVFEVNVVGLTNVASAAASQLKRHRGRLIILNSAFGLVTAPGYGAYSASKASLSMTVTSLRHELAPATVTDCLLGGVDTPIFDRAAELSGTQEATEAAERFRNRVARHNPDIVAAKILKAAVERSSRPAIGADALTIVVADRIAPRLTQRLVNRLVGDHFTQEG